MKQLTIQVKHDGRKLSALKQYAALKDVSIEKELSETISRLYDKLVPLAVREFIEMNDDGEEETEVKSKKTVVVSETKSKELEKQTQALGQEREG